MSSSLSASDQPHEGVRLRIDGRVASICIDRPSVRNAMDAASWRLLGEHLDEVLRSKARVLVLTGGGETFCAGADTSAPRSKDQHPLDRLRNVTEPVTTLQALPIPVIAKVDGAAVGAGLSLALCADLVVATTRARFGTAFAKRGLSLDTGASWLLPRLVGLQNAKRLTYMAETIDAQEAYRMGLVTWVAAPEEIDGFVDDLAVRLSAAPPIALRLDKELLNHAHHRTFAEAIAVENASQVVNMGTDSPTAREALTRGEVPEFTGQWRG